MPKHGLHQPDLHGVRDGCGGTVYRAARNGQLTPPEIRSARFGRTGFGRRGLDPDEVRRFVVRMANEVAALHAELIRARDESNRIKAVLRDWQTRYAARHNARPYPSDVRPVDPTAGSPNSSRRHRLPPSPPPGPAPTPDHPAPPNPPPHP